VAFQRILRSLVAATHGALGAIFLDFEGETVEVVTERPLDADIHDLRVIGAYQGIFLTRLRDISDRLPIGRPLRFKIEFERTSILACDLKEGYYLVLVIDHDANEGMAWRRMEACRNEVIREM
jgi:predicted regulator of Ras-like GTPase activity (Roadblock/LC7/MglB family)